MEQVKTDDWVRVPRGALLELADSCFALEDMNTFDDLAQAIAKLKSAAESACAYLKGDD